MSLQRGPNESTLSDNEGPGLSDPIDVTGKKPAPKRRASRAGTRSVATLSPAQLARKRANDREAQRNIRLRTKEHIERLEARIEELTQGSFTGAELEGVQRRNEELEAEVRQLSENLAQLGDDDSSNNMSGSLSAGSSDRSLASSYQSTSRFGSPSPSLRRGLGTPSYINLQGLGTPSPRAPSYSSAGITRPSISTNRHSFSAAFGPMEGIEQVLGPASTGVLEEPSRLSYFDPIPPMAFNETRTWAAPRSVPSDGLSPEILQPSAPPLQAPGFSSIPIRPAMPPQMQSFDSVMSFSNPWSLRLGSWTLPVLNSTVPTCGMDNVLLNILNQQKELAQQCATDLQAIGPMKPSMKALIYPEDMNQTHMISTMISRLLLSLAVRGLTERAAVLYLMYQFCQWQISPTSLTYGNLTDWASPRTSQLITAHPIWADSILWGKLKDKVIENQALYANEEFQNLYTLCLNANWPYDELDAFRFEGNDVFITEEFESHIRNLSNWSLDERFAIRYPELVDLVRITGVAPREEPSLQGTIGPNPFMG